MKTLNPSKVMPTMRDWYRQQVTVPAEAAQAAKAQRQAHREASLVRTPASADDLLAIAAINPGRVTYPVGSNHKRFAGRMQGKTELTERQREYIWQLVWKFRRQVADRRLIEIANQRRN